MFATDQRFALTRAPSVPYGWVWFSRRLEADDSLRGQLVVAEYTCTCYYSYTRVRYVHVYGTYTFTRTYTAMVHVFVLEH